MDKVNFSNIAFVIDKDYVIWNYNDTAKATFPNVDKGVCCYKAVRGLDKPCPDCPIFQGNKNGRLIYDDSVSKKQMFATFSNIKFNNGTDGYIVSTSEIDPEKEKRDAEIQHLKQKVEIFQRANYYCAYGYFVINVTKNVITSDVYEIIDEVEYKIDMSVRGFIKPIKFSDYAEWFADQKVVIERDKYKDMTNVNRMIERFNAGEKNLDMTMRTRSTMGYLTWHRHSIYMYKIDGNDDIYAIYVMRDIAFKFINDEKSRRNEDIVRILADDYATVLYVDIENESVSFSNFLPNIEKEFKDAVMNKNYADVLGLYVDKKVLPEDASTISRLQDKEFIKEYFATKKSLSITYRTGTKTDFKYYEMKVVKTGDGEPRAFVVGIADKDAEIREKQEQQQKLESALHLAQNDVLTGIRNRTGYDICERKLNADIESGEIKEFAIVMFDVNRLKKTNDIEGHDKGDLMLKNASKLICDIFKHSAVFRTGGDEFVAVVTGEDYQNRDSLLAQLRKTVEENETKDAPAYECVSMASGMALFDPKIDSYVDDVLRRADDLMYENKSIMKIRRRERQRQH